MLVIQLRITILLVFLFVSLSNCFAQKSNRKEQTSSVLNLQLEVFLTVIDDVTIDVYIDGVLDASVGPTTNVCSSRPYDWAISNEGGHPGTECNPGQTSVLNDNQVYEFEFRVLEGGGGKYTYTYFQCNSGYSSVPVGDFYCAIGNGADPDDQDLSFVYSGGTMIVDIESNAFENIDSYFNDDGWLVPHNGFDVFSPITEIEEIGYFVTDQPYVYNPSTGPTFILTDSDFVIPSSSVYAIPQFITWLWDDPMILKFKPNRKLIINDTLTVEDVTLTSSSSNWGGVEVKNGGNANFTNVDILNVGSGAHTGTMTIRDGADVTLKGDNIIIGPNFIAEKGSTFLATHDLSSSAAPNRQDPVLEVNESIIADESTSEFSSGTYPNPFNSSTTLSYQLEEGAWVTLKVYNLLGQEIKTLISEFQETGKWESIWDGRDLSGLPVPSGTYLYRLTAGDLSASGQMVLVK